MGNGPSLKELDFELLKDEDVFTVNQITRNENFSKLHPKYHFWADPMFFYETPEHKPAISDEFYSKMIEVFNNNKDLTVFAVSKPTNGVCKQISKKHKLNYYCSYGAVKDYLNKSLDLSAPCPSFYNVLQYALYTAMVIGYKEIYLLGCEQSNLIMILSTLLHSQNNKYEYGYKITNEEGQRLVSQYNKFPVSVWLKEHSIMFKDFEYLKQIAINNGVAIYNCTKESLVKCFDFASIEDILNEK